MKPESNSRRLFGITRSKGKMYELGLPENLHIAVPTNSEPEELFVLTVGTVGDVAATLNDAENVEVQLPPTTVEEMGFSASFFDAFLESKFSEGIARDSALLAASAYYLARRPGSSLVVARKIDQRVGEAPVDNLLHRTLLAQWNNFPDDTHPIFGTALGKVAKLLAYHFQEGARLTELTSVLLTLRRLAYNGASARDLLFIDIIVAVIRMRVVASAWTALPRFTGITIERWATAISRPDFPKELWPSQMLLGKAGIFSGASGIVQMPTSAGKTRSVEIMLRSSFLSGRTKLTVVVAPFRALCHEIGTSLRHAFREDDVKVNELSDAMQLDFLQQVAELLGSEIPSSQYILVLTPEKFLYLLRQTPSLLRDIGIVVYDEGHQFDSGSRGITYELLLTEIKALLPIGAQTVLVSAVIRNAQAIGEWLIGDGVQVVNGTGVLPTARAVAFASWIERLGQLMFFESESYQQYDYFVPRVIEKHKLVRHLGERIDRYFPDKDNSKKVANDVALYIGIRLVPQGSVAIFCGRKDTASRMAGRAVEVYERSFDVPSPGVSANPDELQRMKNLVDGHFGDQSVTSRAALLGIFVHHGTTPQGLRLSIEYAMQQGQINFVLCTSTLAQGVNLPIRYLIVSSIYQGNEKIKVRDFQNLVGRAGRSGMHTEGLIIFSDPDVYDKRFQRKNSWKFKSSVELLLPDRSESTTSSLLGLFSPLQNSDGKALPLTADDLTSLILSDDAAWRPWADEVVRLNPRFNFNAKELVSELQKRRRLIFAIESHLMANRGNSPFEEFKTAAENLATETLAYHLASDELQSSIRNLFISVAEYIQQQEPATEKQAAYSKTLLGIKSAKEIEQWTNVNREFLLTLNSNEGWLEMVWGLFSEQSDDKFFHTIEPSGLAIQLAMLWLQGTPYFVLFSHSNSEEGSKPWGSNKRSLTEDDIIDFFEKTLGFDCSLILAAVAQFLFGENGIHEEDTAALTLFQKSLKYGLPDWLTVSCYELGFADRVIAQRLCEEVRADGFSGSFFKPAIDLHRDPIEAVLKSYPSYFESVLKGRV